jgi:hypothetical protein
MRLHPVPHEMVGQTKHNLTVLAHNEAQILQPFVKCISAKFMPRMITNLLPQQLQRVLFARICANLVHCYSCWQTVCRVRSCVIGE